MQAATCQILNFAQNPRQNQRGKGTELHLGGGTPHIKNIYTYFLDVGNNWGEEKRERHGRMWQRAYRVNLQRDRTTLLLIKLSFHCFIYLFIYIFTYLFIHLLISLFMSLFISLFLYIFISLHLNFFISLLFIYLFI